MTKKAIITGIAGQDGGYLTELLLGKGYEVHGTCRHIGTASLWRLQELGLANHARLHLIEQDSTDVDAALSMVRHVQPDEVYNLAAQSSVASSFEQPAATAHAIGMGTLNWLEAIRFGKPDTRFYQASTSEMFGMAESVPQREDTPFHPRNPYGVAKLYAHWLTVNYRESHGMFCASGIAFNHESPLRGREFVTRKITDAAARIKTGRLEPLELGNLDARRDWGYAKEYVEAMWRMLQVDEPDTFVLATNRTGSVRDFVTLAFKGVGIEIEFRGRDLEEVAVDAVSGHTVLRINPRFYRPVEAGLLVGDARKAERILGWRPRATLEQLCRMMVQADLERSERALPV